MKILLLIPLLLAGCATIPEREQTDRELDRQAAFELRGVESVKQQRRDGETAIVFPLNE